MADIDAVILVGGKGTRLRPLTCDVPKPMLPTAGYPFLSHLLARIKASGMRHVVLGTSYKAQVFSDYFGDGSDMGLDIDYVTEKQALGTGGGIRNVAGKLRHDEVMVFNGDVLSGASLTALAAAHREAGADVTLNLVQVADPRAFGCVPTDESGRVSAFLEKTEDPPTNQINAGTYVFNREVIDTIPAGRVVSVERDTFPRLLNSGAHIHGHVDSSYWRDMGTTGDFVRGSSDLVRGIVYSPLLEGKTGECMKDPSAKIGRGVLAFGGSSIGKDVSIGSRSRLDDAVVFEGATIGPRCIIKDSIIAAGATIGADCRIVGAVIGAGASIGAGCELIGGMRVWPHVTIARGGIRFSPDAS